MKLLNYLFFNMFGSVLECCELKVDYVIICIICDTDSVNKLTLQTYTLHKYK